MMISAVYAQIMMIVYETILMMMRLRSKGNTRFIRHNHLPRFYFPNPNPSIFASETNHFSVYYWETDVSQQEHLYKRLAAFLYGEGAAEQRENVMKVCICDDLPHVITALEKGNHVRRL